VTIEGSGPGGPPSWRGGGTHSRFGQWGIIAVFSALFLVLTGVAVLIAVLEKPPAPKSVCPPHQVCANPPRLGAPPLVSTAPAIVNEQQFVDPGVGYSLEYPNVLGIASRNATTLELAPRNGNSVLLVVVYGVPASQADPQQLLSAAANALRGSIPDLQSDPDPSQTILAPALAGQAGVGGFYQGTFDTPSGLGAPADVALLASGDGRQTLAVAVISTNRSSTDSLFEFADETILNRLRFRGEIAP
jgi:hypothetical protein